jgi:hypothetical protein
VLDLPHRVETHDTTRVSDSLGNQWNMFIQSIGYPYGFDVLRKSAIDVIAKHTKIDRRSRQNCAATIQDAVSAEHFQNTSTRKLNKTISTSQCTSWPLNSPRPPSKNVRTTSGSTFRMTFNPRSWTTATPSLNTSTHTDPTRRSNLDLETTIRLRNLVFNMSKPCGTPSWISNGWKTTVVLTKIMFRRSHILIIIIIILDRRQTPSNGSEIETCIP